MKWAHAIAVMVRGWSSLIAAIMHCGAQGSGRHRFELWDYLGPMRSLDRTSASSIQYRWYPGYLPTLRVLVTLQKEQHRAELQNQQASFEQQKALLKEQLAHAVRFASDLKASFDKQMAKALLDASNMKKAYEQMACEHASDQKKTVVVTIQVRAGVGGDVGPGGWPIRPRCAEELF